MSSFYFSKSANVSKSDYIHFTKNAYFNTLHETIVIYDEGLLTVDKENKRAL